MRGYRGCLVGDDKDLTIGEVGEVIRRSNKGKAPVPDGIPIEIMKMAYETNKRLFTAILNKCLQEGCFPKTWKKLKVVLFGKEGKKKDDPSSYRPICLINSWAKILDKLITDRLIHFLTITNQLKTNQFGFIQGKSTTKVIRKIIKKVKENKNRKHTTIISLDMKGVFNSVWWKGILYHLMKKRIPRNIYKLIEHYLKEREIYYETDFFKLEKAYGRGCPHGFNSVPILWNVISDSLLELEMPPGVSLKAYADDIIVIITANNRTDTGKIGMEVMRILEEWSENFNPLRSSVAWHSTHVPFIDFFIKRFWKL